MSKWNPKPRSGCDPTRLPLSPQAGVLLSRIDGATSVAGLCQLTGLQRREVLGLLKQLVSHGAVEAPPKPERQKGGRSSSLPELPGEDRTDAAAADPAADRDEPAAAEEPDAAATAAGAATHRKRYRTELAGLERDVRVGLAEKAADPDLAALCFDPDPGVVRAVLANHRVGLSHARLIAAHHRNPAGLEHLARRVRFLRDAAVRRLLLRNNQTPDAVLRRLFEPLPLIQIFKTPLGRECTQRAKRIARETLRKKWQRADGQERAGLVFNTEGRCLQNLTGLHFGGKTTTLLCRRSYNSPQLIQSLARFPATPPKLIAHLLKQAIVRRQQRLKKMLLGHANCPASLKR